MKIMVELTHEEIVGLMRSLLRSIPQTPPKEKDLHSEIYVKLAEWHVQTLPQGVVEGVGHAIDRAIGRG